MFDDMSTNVLKKNMETWLVWKTQYQHIFNRLNKSHICDYLQLIHFSRKVVRNYLAERTWRRSPWNRIVTFYISPQVWASLGAILLFTLALGIVMNWLARRCFRATDDAAVDDQGDVVLRPLWVVQALLIECESEAVILSVLWDKQHFGSLFRA